MVNHNLFQLFFGKIEVKIIEILYRMVNWDYVGDTEDFFSFVLYLFLVVCVNIYSHDIITLVAKLSALVLVIIKFDMWSGFNLHHVTKITMFPESVLWSFQRKKQWFYDYSFYSSRFENFDQICVVSIVTNCSTIILLAEMKCNTYSL